MKIDPQNFDPETLKQEGETSLARQMLQIYRAFNALAQQKYTQAGHIGMTPAHTSLVANIDTKGTRIVILAERMGITKQFAGRLVQELEKVGYVKTAPDPSDRRATLVTATWDGWQFLADACEIRAEVEGFFRDAIGEEKVRAFVEAVATLAALKIDMSGAPEPLELLGTH